MRLSQSPLEGIEEELVTRIERNQRFDLMEAVARLNRRGGEWERIFQVRVPEDWRELILLSYVVGFMHHSKELAERRVIPIHTEDPAEKVILNQVTNFQRKLKRKGFVGYPALGMYVLQNLVSETFGEDSFLYASQRYSLADIRAVVRQYVPRLAPIAKGVPSPPRVAVSG